MKQRLFIIIVLALLITAVAALGIQLQCLRRELQSADGVTDALGVACYKNYEAQAAQKISGPEAKTNGDARPPGR